MRILFLNPPFIGRFSRSSRSPAVTKGGTLYFPIWLAYATGVAEEAGYDVQLIDAPAEGWTLNEVFDTVGSFIPDLVVIDTSTPSIFSDVNVAKEIKKRFSGTVILLVGTHPSALPEETLGLSTVLDAVAIGEYDYIVRDLAAAIDENRPLDHVNGLGFRRNGKIIINEPRKKISDLDRLPFVSSVYKRHLNIKKYFFAAAKFPVIQIITGRGCPFKCFFCVYPQVFHSRRYRMRSYKNVVDEFEYIVREFPEVKEIGIEDDCFTANTKHVRNICQEIIKRNICINWYCNVRGDVDFELIKLMKAAGCRLVTVGFESGCQEILNKIGKGEKIEQYFAFAKAAKKAGILVHGCIMVGNPGDTFQTLEESYRFATRINCDSMQFYPLYVYPGTDAYRWAMEKGYLKTENFSEWVLQDGSHNCVLETPHLSAEEMVRLCDHYLKRYHLRPRYLIKKIIQALRYPSEGYRSLKSARVFAGKLIAR